MCLAQGPQRIDARLVRLEPTTPRSRVKHSTTEPLPSHNLDEVPCSRTQHSATGENQTHNLVIKSIDTFPTELSDMKKCFNQTK